MSNKRLSNEEFFLISRDLEIHHSVFSKIWNIGRPDFTDKIPTACVTFDKQGNHLEFLFNPDFWDQTSEYERNFIICHECLHIILNHGVRLKELNKDLGNVAADVVINEMLLSGFGFERSKLTWIDKNGCWIDTVFKDYPTKVDADRSMEYYYSLLKKDLCDKISKALASGDLRIVDNHDGISGMDPTDLDDALGDILESMNSSDKESLEKSFENSNEEETKECGKQAGTLPGNLQKIIKLGFVKKKRKWETVIKKWANRYITDTDKDHEQWARVNRRFASVDTNLFLPSEMEIEERDSIEKKIKVIFFQDTSGSCSHLAERFFKAAKTLPKDRFDVELYCFDTEVYKTSLESGKLYGFGGTSFSVLDSKINSMCNGDLSKYPKAIFVITDGYGDTISPRKPKNWYWFLSEDYTHYIDKGCNINMLKDFE